MYAPEKYDGPENLNKNPCKFIWKHILKHYQKSHFIFHKSFLNLLESLEPFL